MIDARTPLSESEQSLSALSVRSVTKRFPDGTVALHAVDIQVQRGEFVSLLGPSGCGKTTMLRCIAGLETISGGEIAMGGRVVSSSLKSVPPNERNLGMVFQSYALWPHMTVQENVAYPLRIRKAERSTIPPRVREALELLDMHAKASSYPHELSGGQQQRVALARALVGRPALVLFDEPLSNLDARLRDSIRLMIRNLARELRFTAVYVTHDRLEANVMSDRVVLMRGGSVAQVGTPQQIYRRPRTRFAAEFLGDINAWYGQVLQTEGATAKVAVAGGLVIRGLMNEDQPVARGQPAEVIVRVASARFGASAVDNQFSATVEDEIFLGELWRQRLRLHANGLTAETLSMQALGGPGVNVELGFPVDEVVVLPSTSLASSGDTVP